ncbi:MAG: hypothetical protein NXI20_25395 [bacterium]|nr:hypothetical protein [bacterium]
MKRIVVFLLIILVASIIGGLYGIIHDQVTYTISNEYYTNFKFIQFGFIESWPEAIELSPQRYYVALVGWKATWWMGLPIGVILGLFGFIHKSPIKMFKAVVKSFITTVSIAFLTGLVGLAYCYLFVIPGLDNIQDYPYLWSGVVDPVSFICVGWMHNFSYLGGLTGLIGGVMHIFMLKKNG